MLEGDLQNAEIVIRDDIGGAGAKLERVDATLGIGELGTLLGDLETQLVLGAFSFAIRSCTCLVTNSFVEGGRPTSTGWRRPPPPSVFAAVPRPAGVVFRSIVKHRLGLRLRLARGERRVVLRAA